MSIEKGQFGTLANSVGNIHTFCNVQNSVRFTHIYFTFAMSSTNRLSF